MVEENANVDNSTLDGDNQVDNGEKGKVVYTPEQQEHTQKLIDEAYRRASKKANEGRESDRIDSNAKIQKLTEDIEALNKKPAQTPDSVTEHTKVIDQLNQELKEKDQRFEAQNESVRNADKERALYGAISGHDVVDAQGVKMLTINSIGINENGDVYVKGEGDSPKLNKHGEAISVKEYMTEWLSDNPHFLRGSNGGAGGAGNMGSNGKTPKYDLSNPATIRDIPEEDFQRLLKEGINIKGSANQNLKFGTQTNKFQEIRKRKFKG